MPEMTQAAAASEATDFFAALLGVLADPEGFQIREHGGELYLEPNGAH